MNPIPPDGVMPATRLFANGSLDLLLLITMASLFVVFGMMLWTLRRATRERTKVLCPEHLRPARVRFQLAADGMRTDVLGCSLLGRRPVTCARACLKAAA